MKKLGKMYIPINTGSVWNVKVKLLENGGFPSLSPNISCQNYCIVRTRSNSNILAQKKKKKKKKEEKVQIQQRNWCFFFFFWIRFLFKTLQATKTKKLNMQFLNTAHKRGRRYVIFKGLMNTLTLSLKIFLHIVIID